MTIMKENKLYYYNDRVTYRTAPIKPNYGRGVCAPNAYGCCRHLKTQKNNKETFFFMTMMMIGKIVAR